MPRDVSRETRIHLALWRKAFREDGFSVTFPSYSAALRMRLALYRAIKPYRLNEFLDPELYQAQLRYVAAVPRDSCVLSITNRRSLEEAESLFAQLGLGEEDLYSPDELAVQKRMTEELDKLIVREPEEEVPPIDPSANPFFTRED